MPPWGWWPLGIVGLALWVELLTEPRRWRRAVLSALAAVAWLAPSTVWMADFTLVGWPVAVTGFAAMHAAAGAIVPHDRRRWVAFPAAFALAELLRWNWPFGGVPIATVAMAQVSGPMAGTARIGGALLLVWLTAVAATILAMFATRRPRSALIGATILVVTVTAAAYAPQGSPAPPHTTPAPPHTTPTPPHTTDASIRVAAVQGGGQQNTRADLCAQRDVFERHMQVTRSQIIAPVDLIVWPEDVVHLSPADAVAPNRCGNQRLLKAPEVRDRISDLARDTGAVLLAGFFERNPDDISNRNYVAAFDASGAVVDEYEKHWLVPFGEYVPLRSLIERFSNEVPSLDVRPGPADKPAVVQTPLGPLGVSISWEVFFGHRARSAIGNSDEGKHTTGNSGGLLLLNPTNGSSYWLAILQSQQIAASRLRAIETGRWVVQAAPTGFSAVITPSGEVVERTGISESRVIQATVVLRSGDTLAVRMGVLPVAIAAALTLTLCTAWNHILKRWARRPRSA